MNGKELLVEIKKLQYLDHIPLIIYSTSSSHNDIEDARDLGATHYLSKPASIYILTHILNDIFNKNDLPFLLSLKSGTGNH